LRAGAARAAWLLPVVLATAPGCRQRWPTSPGEAVVEPEPLPDVLAEGFVVLPWGTQTYLEPRFGGASARLGSPSALPPPWPTGGYVARVMGQRDGFIEIAPFMQPVTAAHCGPLLDGEAFDVRLYVSPWALAPVLARELEVSLDDGTTLSLRPGVLAQPIPGDPQGRWAISAGGIRVRAVIPADAMALAYAVPLPMTMPSQRGWQLPEDRPFSFDGWPIEVDLGFGHDVAIAAVTPQDDAYRVELTSPCARVLAHARQAPASWAQEPFDHFVEFGLGGPRAVPAGVLEAVGLAEPVEVGVVIELAPDEGDPPPEPSHKVTTFELEEVPLDLVQPSQGSFDAIGTISGESGIIGGVIGGSLPARPEHVFEQGAPVYLSTAGPAAGTLADMRVFSEDGWTAGDRMCFQTSFGFRFDPALPVCLPADEARLRNPTVDVFDFSSGVVRPATLHVTGALSEPAVARALRRNRGDLRRCFGEAQMRGSAPLGDLGLGLDVDGLGMVTEVEPLSLPIQGFTECVVTAAKRWAMPAPEDGKPARIVFSVSLELR
jgi:hypothetical protein